MRIAIIEDDEKIRHELLLFLQKYGYEVCALENFDNVIGDVLNKNPDLILLDVNLPLFDGYYVCREIRKLSAVPIIIVTSRNTEMDELMGMNLGADDFVSKPYNMQILLARIEAVLKRAYKTGFAQKLSYNGVSLDLSKGTAEFDGRCIELTKNEIKILHLLIKNAGKVISRDEIMNALWQSNEFVDDNTLTVNINRLRKKLEEIGVGDFLITKRGQGYMV
ncbi:MAG: DNA-binding response regulator [Oscillospiraceae bacterium]|jgi:DNA-binding response OmpR family regulator|nr:DNA-binding response regulator [Oscillospiraceae bacterium]